MWQKQCPIEDGGCGKLFCSNCLSYACVTLKNSQALGVNSPISTFCKDCFMKSSSLDFSTNVTILGPDADTAPSLLFLHGGAGSRIMFNSHASRLAEKGYRCILLDLPGHGGSFQEELTLETALIRISQALELYTKPFRGVGPVVIGGSLGGYLTMELIGRSPGLASAAIVMMCGQNVGSGRSMLASVGLSAMNLVLPMLSSATMMSGLVSESRKNAQISNDSIMEIVLRPGMFFHQGKAQVAILRSTDPAYQLPKFPGPVLFLNGSLDHRDSEHRWVSMCRQGRLVVYEGGDHFFSHDDRFFGSVIEEIDTFAKKLFFADPDPTASASSSLPDPDSVGLLDAKSLT